MRKELAKTTLRIGGGPEHVHPIDNTSPLSMTVRGNPAPQHCSTHRWLPCQQPAASGLCALAWLLAPSPLKSQPRSRKSTTAVATAVRASPASTPRTRAAHGRATTPQPLPKEPLPPRAPRGTRRDLTRLVPDASDEAERLPVTASITSHPLSGPTTGATTSRPPRELGPLCARGLAGHPTCPALRLRELALFCLRRCIKTRRRPTS